MAAIDYTQIVFHNGKLMKKCYKIEDDKFISYLPFDYSIHGTIDSNEKTYKYMPELKTIVKGDIRYRYGYSKEIDTEVIICETDNYNVIFYANGDDSYVMLGGYGHMVNPYTHFYNRGLPEEVECLLMSECFEWLITDVLDSCIYNIDDLNCNALYDTYYLEAVLRSIQADHHYFYSEYNTLKPMKIDEESNLKEYWRE